MPTWHRGRSSTAVKSAACRGNSTSENAVHADSIVVESVARGGTFQLYPFGGVIRTSLSAQQKNLRKPPVNS